MASAEVAAPRPLRSVRSAAVRAMERLSQSRSPSPALSVASSTESRASRASRRSESKEAAGTGSAAEPRTPTRTPSRPTSAAKRLGKAKSKSKTPSRAASTTPSRTEKRFVCTRPGCEKAYTKPSRLAEHERTHTGERPHVCAECGQSYLRSTHLAAHMRTHKNPEDKAFTCSRDGCGKKFWTATHLRRHEVLHDSTEVHECHVCGLTFPKTHFLREHIAATHEPERRPFACTHPGCGMAFAMRQQLKTHEKIHDPTRYTCSHPDHGDDMPTFPVWSALQTHIRVEHPPTCPYGECGGRTFKNSTRLREHLKVHDQRETDKSMVDTYDEELPPVIAEGLSRRTRRKRRRSDRTDASRVIDDGITSDGDDDTADPSLMPQDEPEEPTTPSSPPRKLPRLLSGETGKDWTCGAPGCGKAFKSKFARDEHAQAAHTRARHKCDKCGRAYRRPASLKRHLAEGWCGGNTPRSPQTPRTPRTPKGAGASQPATPHMPDEGALLTGTAHFPGGSEHRRWACPFVDGDEVCGYRFHRVYDVRRHLASEHDVKVDDMGTREMLLADGQTGEE